MVNEAFLFNPFPAGPFALLVPVSSKTLAGREIKRTRSVHFESIITMLHKRLPDKADFKQDVIMTYVLGRKHVAGHVTSQGQGLGLW